MANPQDFTAWACNPARTNDELFTVELLIERMRFDQAWPFKHRQGKHEAEFSKKKKRRLDPAYRPAPARDEIEELVRQSEKVRFLHSSSGSYERPMRDLKALAFFPALEDVGISDSDISDFSPLTELPQLKRLSVSEIVLVGGHHPICLGEWGEMRCLEYFHLSVRGAWPDLKALAQWPVLREFHFNGNILALCEVEELPAAESVEIGEFSRHNVPLRDLTGFPAMPKLRRLTLESTSSLSGLERYAHVLNLKLSGDFRDLTPLGALSNTTYLRLEGEHFRDLMPLTRMPKLRELVLERERSLDLAVLSEAPQLRRVSFFECEMMRTELAALNAGLLSEATDFEANTPRPLDALKFFVTKAGNPAGWKFFHKRDEETWKARTDWYRSDEAWAKAETRWFGETLQAKLDALLGRGWGLAKGCGFPGDAHLTFKRFADTSRIREIVQLLREESARSRFPWHYYVNVEPHGDMSIELEELREIDEEEKSQGPFVPEVRGAEELLEDYQEMILQSQQKQEYLRREHLVRLQEEGVIVELDLHESPKGEASSDMSPSNEDQAGDTIDSVPPPSEESLSEALSYLIRIYEDCVVVPDGWEEAAAYALGKTPVEWPG